MTRSRTRSGSLYRRIRWRVRKRRGPLSVLALLLVGAAVAYVAWPGPDLRSGSEALPEGPVRVAERLPEAYRVVYRAETHAGGESVVSTERVWVRRPFEARVETWTGPPPGRRRTATTINTFGRIRAGSGVFAIAPAPTPQDYRLDAVLEEAGEAGYLLPRERRRVAGRVCRVYRRAGETGSGTLVRIEEGSQDFTDVCFDESGIALEEATFVSGDLLHRRIAVEVSEDPEMDDELFRTGDPEIDVRRGGGSVRELESNSRPPGTFWELAEEPPGFRRHGRYAVIPPQAGFDDPVQRGGILAFTTDVWVRGPDVLVIEQGSTLGGQPPFAEDPEAQRVRAGELGRGELVYGLRGSEVRVLLGAGRFVRVVGTLKPSRLLATARSLEEVEGGSLVYLDEAPPN